MAKLAIVGANDRIDWVIGGDSDMVRWWKWYDIPFAGKHAKWRANKREDRHPGGHFLRLAKMIRRSIDLGSEVRDSEAPRLWPA